MFLKAHPILGVLGRTWNCENMNVCYWRRWSNVPCVAMLSKVTIMLLTQHGKTTKNITYRRNLPVSISGMGSILDVSLDMEAICTALLSTIYSLDINVVRMDNIYTQVLFTLQCLILVTRLGHLLFCTRGLYCPCSAAQKQTSAKNCQ